LRASKNGFSEQDDEGKRHYDVFEDPMTTLAAIDRVVHHSVILDMMSEESYRAEVANQHHLSKETGSGLLNRNQ
jgi:hypothetical protein